MTSREAVDICEIDILYCRLAWKQTNGFGTCNADGDVPCFNTRATTQSPEDFDPAPVTLRFAKKSQTVPVEWDAIPSLEEVQHSPATISMGKSLGERASVTFVFRDHQWGDAGPGLDKYWRDRPYDPAKQGTFWGKIRARHWSLRGRSIRWRTGFVGQSLAEMETRHYVIESIDGPLRDGTFHVIAKDVLKLADGDRSQTPPLTHGALASGLAANGTSFTAVFPPGFTNAEYPTSAHWVSIGGNEIIRVTRSGNTFSVASGGRAQFGTTAVVHTAGDRIQLCRVWSAQPPSVILNDIFANDCGIDPSYIPLAEWEEEEETYLQRLFTRCVAEPTASRQIIDALIEQAGLSVWSDETAPAIRMQVIRGIPSDAAVFSPETNILAGSMSFRDQPDTRISRCVTRFAQRTPLLRASEPQSFRSVRALVDGDSESIFGSPAIREIQGTFIPQFGDTTADRTNELQTGRFARPPRRFQFKVSRVGGIVPFMGLGARLRWPGIIQDEFGADTDTPIQITRVKPGPAYDVEAEEMLVKLFNPQDITNRVILINASSNNLNLLTVHNSLYPVLTPTDVANGVNVTFILTAGVTVNSTSTSAPAIDIPAGWPSGLPITVDIYGWVLGRGANAAAAVSGFVAGNPGLKGGIALRVRFPILLNILSGARIWSGGGSGGSGGGAQNTRSSANGSGTALDAGRGGGGAGTPPGTPGASATAGAPGSDGEEGVSAFGSFAGDGGDGGAPGQPGQAGTTGRSRLIVDGQLGGFATRPGGAAGPAGAQIDGISNVTIGTDSGDRRGPTIN